MNNEFPVNRGDVSEMAGEVAQVVKRLPRYARLVWLLLKDPALSAKQRTVLMAAVGYSISPIDAVPGFIPVVGQLDDLAVVLYSVRWVLRAVPVDRADDYLAKSDLSLAIIDEDLDMVRRSGVKVLKKMVKIMGWTALAVLGMAVGIGKGLRDRAEGK